MSEPSSLSGWESFYVIVGSSAGALTGLQFVVITLVAEMRAATSMMVIHAFGTPTIVHLCMALVISAILSAPWPSLAGADFALGICGAVGVLYALNVVRRARKSTDYKPDREDWFWYVLLPIITYGVLLAASLALTRNPGRWLYVVAAVALLLLFIGIRNAWDTVTYIAVSRGRDKKQESPKS